MGLQTSFEPTAGRHWSEPQHLAILGNGQCIQLQLPMIQPPWAPLGKSREGIGEQRPARCQHPTVYCLLISRQILR